MLTGFDGVKVFSATMVKERGELGTLVTDWLTAQRRERPAKGADPGFEVVDTQTMQSSDNAFHCITIIVFYKLGARPTGARS